MASKINSFSDKKRCVDVTDFLVSIGLENGDSDFLGDKHLMLQYF